MASDSRLTEPKLAFTKGLRPEKVDADDDDKTDGDPCRILHWGEDVVKRRVWERLHLLMYSSLDSDTVSVGQ